MDYRIIGLSDYSYGPVFYIFNAMKTNQIFKITEEMKAGKSEA